MENLEPQHSLPEAASVSPNQGWVLCPRREGSVLGTADPGVKKLPLRGAAEGKTTR